MYDQKALAGVLSKQKQREFEVKLIKNEIEMTQALLADAIANKKTEADKLQIEKLITQEKKLQADLAEKEQTGSQKALSRLQDYLDGFKTDFGVGGEGSLGNAPGVLSLLATALNSNDPFALSEAVGQQITTAADAIIPGLGSAIRTVGALFSSTVSEAEIEAAKGRVDFTDNSLANLKDIFEEAQNPLLESTYEMTKYLQSMDRNFTRLGNSLAGTTGGSINLTGADYEPTARGGFFSASSRSLIGIGLDFGTVTYDNFTSGLIQGYQTELKKSSTLFGIIKKEKILQKAIQLTVEQRGTIEDAFASGYELMFTALATLGMGQYSEALKAVEVKIGKVNLEGLSPEEAQQRIESVYSEYFSTVLSGSYNVETFVEKYQQSGEAQLETLTRLALTYDQSSALLADIGRTFMAEAPVTKMITEYVTELVNVGSSIFSTTETVTSIMTRAVEVVYSAEEKILDIVAGAGGQDAFSSAMATYIDNFFTEQEKLNIMTGNLEDQFATLGVVMPKTNEGFRKLIDSFQVTDEASANTYGQLLTLAGSFYNMTELASDLANTSNDAYEQSVSAIQKISEAWLGNLSYLTRAQKAEFASGYYKMGLSADQGAINTVEAARLAAETALAATSTREEYIPVFERYIAELEKEVSDASLNDVVGKLDVLIDSIRELEDTYIQTSYTQAG